MIAYKIEIEIDKIKVDERYYSFTWKAQIGKKTYKGKYDDSYEGSTQTEMKKILEKDYALEIVLGKLSEG